jgi:metal-responsive CopG/Arc/MetJ family transcriptional regulator
VARSRKFACSIDPDLLQRVERLRARTGESRSALVSRALVKLTQEAAHAASVQRYVEAYRETPETEYEVQSARELARGVLRQVPWGNE